MSPIPSTSSKNCTSIDTTDPHPTRPTPMSQCPRPQSSSSVSSESNYMQKNHQCPNVASPISTRPHLSCQMALQSQSKKSPMSPLSFAIIPQPRITSHRKKQECPNVPGLHRPVPAYQNQTTDKSQANVPMSPTPIPSVQGLTFHVAYKPHAKKHTNVPMSRSRRPILPFNEIPNNLFSQRSQRLEASNRGLSPKRTTQKYILLNVPVSDILKQAYFSCEEDIQKMYFTNVPTVSIRSGPPLADHPIRLAGALHV